jgi:hypothetical protein
MNDYAIALLFLFLGMIPAVIYGIFFEGKERPMQTSRTVQEIAPRPKQKDPLLQAFTDPKLSDEKFKEIFTELLRGGTKC